MLVTQKLLQEITRLGKDSVLLGVGDGTVQSNPIVKKIFEDIGVFSEIEANRVKNAYEMSYKAEKARQNE